MKKHAAPIIAAVLLLLPVLYVGSYFALVVPNGVMALDQQDGAEYLYPHRHYRVHSRLEDTVANIFWPLEQVHREVRPGAWVPKFRSSRG